MKTDIAPPGFRKPSTPRALRVAAPPRPFAVELDRLILEQDFDIHFQPIVGGISSANLDIFGYEALTRPRVQSGFASPLALFEVAAELGRLIELERLVVRKIVQRFAELACPAACSSTSAPTRWSRPSTVSF